MLLDLFAFFVVAASAVAVADHRRGLLLAIVVGVLQDPVRKLLPGTPALLAVASLPVVAAALAGLFLRDRQAFARLARAHPALVRAMRWFVPALLPGIAVVLLAHGGSAWRAALLGSFGYLTPLLALVWGFNYVRQVRDLQQVLMFYALFTALTLVGTLLDFLQLAVDWAALGTSAFGAPWLRFTPSGLVIRLVSGFYRSPDVMGWHAATLVMAAGTLLLARRRALAWLWLPLAAWGVFGVFVCGRRKAMLMPLVWAALVLAQFLSARRAGRALGLAALLAALAAGLLLAGGERVIQPEYYAYAASLAGEAPQRLREGTLHGVWWTLLQSGVLGAGIGTASQGAQHLGGDVTQGWQESGAAKLMAELGLPGLACGLWLAWQLLWAGGRALRRSAAAAPGHVLQVGLAGMALANAASFVVSHQVYGDLLVMTLSTFFTGVALSGPRWCPAPEPGGGRRSRPAVWPPVQAP